MTKHILLIPAFLALAACNGGPNQTNIELVTNMMDQPAIKSQGWDHHDDKVQMRMPPDHTISRGNPPYMYANDPAGAEKQPNPLKGNMSPETMTLGHDTFEIYCALCHGDTGAGDGRIASHMSVKPRNLISAEAKGYTDGRIFHAITMGKGVMGSYQSQITDANRRWAVVNYVRTLQKQAK